MRRGDRLPDDQAEVVFSDVFVEQLEDITDGEQVDVLAAVVRLCEDPAGKHPLSRALAGWNTIEALGGHKRVVYKASDVDGVGLVEVLCLGPRSDSEVYDMARALQLSGALKPEEVTAIWEALGLLEVLAESIGLDGWDFRPKPAPEGMVRSVVGAGLLTEDVARILSKDELEAAMEKGWATGTADPVAAVRAAFERARGRVSFQGRDLVQERKKKRCGAAMPRAGVRCIRKDGHPGPHRAT